QGRVIEAGLDRAQGLSAVPGRFERMMLSALSRMDTNLSPAQMYRLGRTMLSVDTAKVRNCVIPGGTGTAGGASVVFLDRGALSRVMGHVRNDATLRGGC
ncbi:MAG: LCP family protein, partial [Nocardioidaceae bacterium]